MGIETTVREFISPSTYNELMKLPENQRENVMAFFGTSKKTFGLTLLFWFFGAHYFYLRQIGTGFLFILTLGGLAVWWGIDLFKIRKLMTDENDKIMLSQIAEIRN